MTSPFGPDDLTTVVDDEFDGPDPNCDCEDCVDELAFAAIVAQLAGEVQA